MLGSRVGAINSQKVSSVPGGITPFIWFDPSDTSTLTLSGSQITQIASKTGSTSGIVCKVPYTTSYSGTPTVGPTLNSGTLNGKNTMLFNSGTPNGLQSNTYYQLPNTIMCGFIVCKLSSAAVTILDHVKQGRTTSGICAILVNAEPDRPFQIASAFIGSRNVNGTPINTWLYIYWEAKLVSGTTTTKLYINGVSQTFNVTDPDIGLSQITGGNFLFSIGGPLLYSGSYYPGYNMKGEIAEIIEYTNVLSDSDRIAVENYLKTKYNL